MTGPSARPGAKGHFDFMGKLLQADLRPQLTQLVDGTLSAPMLVELDPTSTCNFSCPNCISGDLLNRGRMPTDELLELVETIGDAGVRGVILIGGGEPHAHPPHGRVLRRLAERSVAVGLTTNGTLLRRHRDLVARTCSWVRVSVDAGSAETFDYFRPSRLPEAFRLVLGEMRALAGADPRPTVGYSFLLQWGEVLPVTVTGSAASGGPAPSVTVDGRRIVTNLHEIAQAAAVARATGCDYFEVKPAVDARHALRPLPDELHPLLVDQLERAAELVDDGFDVVVTSGIRQLLTGRTDQPKHYDQCPVIRARTLITHEGVFPCPYFRGVADRQISVTATEALRDWPGTIQMLDQIVSPRRDCSFFCIRHPVNTFLDSLISLRGVGVDLLAHLAETDAAGDPFF
jgi:hypothetical protein